MFMGFMTENNILEVSGKLLCIWLMNYPIWTNIWWVYSGSHFWHFKDFWGHLFSAKTCTSAKASQAHSGMSVPPTLTRVLSFYRLYRPIHQPECTLPKGGGGEGGTIKLQILLNVSGTIKNVYCSIEILQVIFTKSTTYLVNRLLDCLLNVMYLFLWNFFFHNPYQPSSIVGEC